MSSPLNVVQIEANRRNAQQSTGPRTEAGKAISSRNALKSGLFTAQDFVRPEETEEYAETLATLRAELGAGHGAMVTLRRPE